VQKQTAPTGAGKDGLGAAQRKKYKRERNQNGNVHPAKNRWQIRKESMEQFKEAWSLTRKRSLIGTETEKNPLNGRKDGPRHILSLGR